MWYKYKGNNFSLQAQTFLLSSRTFSFTELGLLSELRVGPTKRERSSMKCQEIYALRLVRVGVPFKWIEPSAVLQSAGHLETRCPCDVSRRELFAYGGCGPAVSTSHLTPPPQIGNIALTQGKLRTIP